MAACKQNDSSFPDGTKNFNLAADDDDERISTDSHPQDCAKDVSMDGVIVASADPQKMVRGLPPCLLPPTNTRVVNFWNFNIGPTG
mmetsp:Transcript_7806/g.11335  ORF Transcript_7806/g.11335 Transcript_7806/m.11335 type:complete len:86 (+) Transcript_7806:857-1114(+)